MLISLSSDSKLHTHVDRDRERDGVRCSVLVGDDLLQLWAPASQEGSHVGHAGIGMISLKGALVAMPTLATTAFRRYFDLGRLVRCVLPLGNGRLMHLVVAYGFQGADDDAEKLGFTDQLFDAVMCELAVISSGQSCVIAGDFNVEPTRIPCL